MWSRRTEVRQLAPSHRLALSHILASGDTWKVLMSSIPRSKEDPHNKYTTQHVNIVEDASRRTARLAFEILLEEWGTSGRVRPTVGDLLELCRDCDLIHAAHYILCDVLGEEEEEEQQQESAAYARQPASCAEEPGYSAQNGHRTDVWGGARRDVAAGAGGALPKYSAATNDQLNEALGSMLVSSEAASSLHPRDIPEDISLIQSPLPQFSYSFLETITNHFCDVPHGQGGNKLGSGAFGSVYFGKLSGQLGLENKNVAVKRLSRETLNIGEQFNNEIEMMGLVSHPNILTLLAYSSDGDDLCLLYPYMENGSLEERLAHKVHGKPALAPMQRLKVAHGVADGLRYLHNASHSKPLVHRDVKSANILLNAQLEPKIGDFGLVRLGSGGGAGGGAGRTSTVLTTTVVGTSAYMAPEAIRGEVTVKLDVFSFGVVLLELLTGLPPVDDKRENRDLITHIEETCDDDDDILPHLDPACSKLDWRQVSPQRIYLLAMNCIKKKKDRPLMNVVCDTLQEIFL